ncbi:MAG: 23S rRNA (pseudouridine(1915)-N(3))-methyltransferase RlmH [Patescibacteria group bacterium]|nr:23S rRNA (pseudouridine(1915)-N(3))-methyltransferase RlmH [Patescibacteria group bacterium]
MKISILAVGKLKESFLREARDEFVKRLGPYAKLNIVEVEAERLDGSVSDEEAMRREGERLLGRVADGAFVAALDRGGKQMSSEAFAKFIETTGADGTEIVFIIGGAAGLHADVLSRANQKLSLSEMTLPHEMARTVLLEQIYRAMQILKGGKYHR